uniref:Uncharacterized protein n=1 Tax=Cannabis sativa TaxID=3483 RepID=A0A803RAE5_CANSA
MILSINYLFCINFNNQVLYFYYFDINYCLVAFVYGDRYFGVFEGSCNIPCPHSPEMRIIPWILLLYIYSEMNGNKDKCCAMCCSMPCKEEEVTR